MRRLRHIAAGLCPNCGTRSARDGGQYCLTCAETNAISRIKYRYGLTREQLRAQLEKQDHRCAICRDELTAPHIDHHHGNNSFRGLLCANCNVGIGALKDNPAILSRAADYVRWNGLPEIDAHDLEVAA